MIIDCISEIEHVKIEDGSFLIVKVGSDTWPATTADIEDVKKSIIDLGIPDLKCLVTHSSVDFKLFTCSKGE